MMRKLMILLLLFGCSLGLGRGSIDHKTDDYRIRVAYEQIGLSEVGELSSSFKVVYPENSTALSLIAYRFRIILENRSEDDLFTYYVNPDDIQVRIEQYYENEYAKQVSVTFGKSGRSDASMVTIARRETFVLAEFILLAEADVERFYRAVRGPSDSMAVTNLFFISISDLYIKQSSEVGESLDFMIQRYASRIITSQLPLEYKWHKNRILFDNPIDPFSTPGSVVTNKGGFPWNRSGSASESDVALKITVKPLSLSDRMPEIMRGDVVVVKSEVMGGMFYIYLPFQALISNESDSVLRVPTSGFELRLGSDEEYEGQQKVRQTFDLVFDHVSRVYPAEKFGLTDLGPGESVSLGSFVLCVPFPYMPTVPSKEDFVENALRPSIPWLDFYVTERFADKYSVISFNGSFDLLSLAEVDGVSFSPLVDLQSLRDQ